MAGLEIEILGHTAAAVSELGELLIDTVAGGASVSFMHPVTPAAARAFWGDSLARAARGERVILGARNGGRLIGTVTLLLDFPPNQPHRAEIAKAMVRADQRGNGVGSALIEAAERLAVGRGRTLIVLDTAEDGGASRFYQGLGYQLTGLIPDYALKPYGGLSATMIYWKRLPPADGASAPLTSS